MYIDTHAHLYAKEFEEDIDSVIKRAKGVGVDRIYLPNIDSDSITGLNALLEAHPSFFIGMMGLHPCSVDVAYEPALKVIKEELYKGHYCAVGEIGMDLYWDKSTKNIQELAFIEQCEWASDLNLPIAIHSRESTRELIDILKANQHLNIKGVFHCFGGSHDEAKEILDLGFYLGIGGVITFKNSTLKDVLKGIPLTSIVLETDAPYLAPTPYRGKRNESSYLTHIAEALSNVYGMSSEAIGERTSQNAKELFSR